MYIYIYRQTWQTCFTWLWRWPPLRPSKHQSPTIIFLKATTTWTINFTLLMIILGSNNLLHAEPSLQTVLNKCCHLSVLIWSTGNISNCDFTLHLYILTIWLLFPCLFLIIKFVSDCFYYIFLYHISCHIWILRTLAVC